MPKKARYNDDDVREALRAEIERKGSLRKLAAEIGVVPGHISQVLRQGLPPGPRVASYLGYREDGFRWVKGD